MREGGQDVAVGVLEDLGGDGEVMVLEHTLVVVHQRQLRTCIRSNLSKMRLAYQQPLQAWGVGFGQLASMYVTKRNI